MERKSFPIEIKAFDEATGSFAMHAGVFHSIDSYGHIFAPGAFADALEGFLARGFIAGTNHNWDQPIGRPTKAQEDETGLYVEGTISDTAAGRDTRTLMKDKVLRFASFAYERAGWSRLMTGDAVMAHWNSVGYTPSAQDLARVKKFAKSDDVEAEYAPGVTLITNVNPIYEASPTTIPANYGAGIISAKAGLPAGLPFADHSEAVLAAVEEFTTRAREISDLRTKDGRALGEERRQQLSGIAERLSACQQALSGLLAPAAKAEAKADPALVARLHAQFLAHQAKSLGAIIEGV